MGGKKTDFTGLKLGHLTVIEPTGRHDGNGRAIWRCDCDCGNTIYLDSRALKRTKRRDCGCNILNSPFVKDLTGQRFGKLVCLYPTGDKDSSGGLIWHCRCDCGNESNFSAHLLKSGRTRTCGCSRNAVIKDYVGKRFGSLTVIEHAGMGINSTHLWKCRCDCGTIVIARQPRLESGYTTSCGCTYTERINALKKLYDGTGISFLEYNLSGKLRSSNKSGVTGVFFDSRNNKWIARITLRKKLYSLGSYKNKEDAIKARKRAEEELFEPVIEEYYRSKETEETPTS